MYAVRDYHDQPLQFINTVYFHTKTESDKHYDTVVTIWILVVFLKISLLFLMIYLSFHHIISTSAKIMQKLARIHTTETDSFLSVLEVAAAHCKDGTLTIGKFSENDVIKCKQKAYLIELTVDSVRTLSLNNNNSEHTPNVHLIKLEDDTHNYIAQELSKMKQQGVANVKYFLDSNNGKEICVIKLFDKNKWKLDIQSLIFVNIICIFTMFGFHIASIAESFHYSNEVLKVNNAVITDTISAGSFFLFVLICFLHKWIILSRSHNKMYRNDGLVAIAAELVALNLIYIVSYFMPYMFLAFIFDPLLTIANYFFLVLNILSLYLYASCLLFKKEQENEQENEEVEGKEIISITFNFILRFLAIMIFPLFVIYISIIFKLMLKLGSFDDFKVGQSLLLPLVIAFTGYIIVKPIYKKIKRKIDLENSNKESLEQTV